MALAIVSYPELAPVDSAWIEAGRRRRDPQAGIVGAHFTLVFPVEGLDAAAVANHAQAVAGATPPIVFQLTTAHAFRDRFSTASHVFLTPAAGQAEIRRLHATLYDGILTAHLRSDISYVPHITVAAAETFEEAKEIAVGLGEIAIEGRLTSLDLVGFDGRTVTPLRRFPLAG